jgi:hypothetical protein
VLGLFVGGGRSHVNELLVIFLDDLLSLDGISPDYFLDLQSLNTVLLVSFSELGLQVPDLQVKFLNLLVK